MLYLTKRVQQNQKKIKVKNKNIYTFSSSTHKSEFCNSNLNFLKNNKQTKNNNVHVVCYKRHHTLFLQNTCYTYTDTLNHSSCLHLWVDLCQMLPSQIRQRQCLVHTLVHHRQSQLQDWLVGMDSRSFCQVGTAHLKDYDYV